MTNDELKDLLRTLTDRELAAVLGVLMKYKESAERSVGRLQAQRTRENREQIDRHILYWEHVASGFRWLSGVTVQCVKPKEASNGKASRTGVPTGRPANRPGRPKTGRKVRSRVAPVERPAG